MFVEKAGLGPADGVKIAVKPSGHVEVITGGDAEETRKWVEAAGGKWIMDDPDPAGGNFYEVKLTDPNGVIFDLTHNRWGGLKCLPGTHGRESKPLRKLVEHFSERRTKALADIKKMSGETKAVAPELAKVGK